MPEATSPAPSPTTAAGSGARRELLFFAATLVVAGGVLAYLVTVADARLDAPTIALAAGAVALLYALRQMFSVVQALSRPPVEHFLNELTESSGPASELRRKRFRVLRAIKQLDEDHALGKLSDADHDLMRQELVLQAVELNRQLDGGSEGLHPALQALLGGGANADATVDAEHPPLNERPSEVPTEQLALCPACKGHNDVDARFCKHCGGAMQVSKTEPEPPSDPMRISGEIEA